MADPVNFPCLVDEYQLVAINVTAGTLMIVDTAPSLYSWTYVMNGNAAPGNTDLSNAAVMDAQQPFSFAAGVDIYVRPKGAGGEVSVRV